MCCLCAISRWSRRVASMLPWLVIPFIIVCALSQLLPPNYRLEIALSRLACLGVLMLSVVWYEILMPRLSSWRAHRSAVLRERKLIEALAAAKWRKEATRRCRNCLSAYKVQMPGSGKYVCTFCGHISKRPVLEVAGNVANSRLTMSGSPVNNNGAGMSNMRAVCQRNGPLTAWYRAAERNHCDWFGESSYLDHKCSLRQSFPSLIFKACLVLWTKVLGMGKSTSDGCHSVNGTSEMDDASSRLEKARRKADKKKQARLQKELLEAEDRKQREEVASLVEERRRQRDELEILQQKYREANTKKQKETNKERDNDKPIDKSSRKSGKSETTGPFDQGLEHVVGLVQETSKDAGDKLAAFAGSSKEQTNGSITTSISSKASAQSHLSKFCAMDRISRLGFLKRSGSTAHKTPVSAPKASLSPQGENIPRIKKESAYAGKTIMPNGCSNASPGVAGDTPVPSLAWKRAPWISAWVTRRELSLASNIAQKEVVSNDKRRSIEQDTRTGFDSFTNFSLIKKPSISTARAVAIQPPIAPPSICADPLQQLFSAPSLFPPMDLCANVSHSSGQKSQNEAKHVFLPEHTFFKSQKFTESTDILMTPCAPSFDQPTSDKGASLSQTAISSLSSFGQTNLVPQCSLLADTSCKCEHAFTERSTAEMLSCDVPYVSGLVTSTGREMSVLELEQAGNINTYTDNTLLWENADEEAVPLSTVEVLLETDLFMPDASLSSSQESEREKPKEDLLDETGLASDQNSLFSALNTYDPVWDDTDCNQKVPAEFVDCITQEIMEDPVIKADGHSYERIATENWIKSKLQCVA